MSLSDFSEYAIDPDPAWEAAGWEDAWHPDNTDIWEYIGEVINDALDYLDDAGYC